MFSDRGHMERNLESENLPFLLIIEEIFHSLTIPDNAR